jgi:spermidine synthase
MRLGTQFSVFENGALAFDTEGVSAEAFADLAAVQHPDPRRALVIGGGGEGVPDALSRHGIPVIHDLEIDRRAFERVRLHTGAGDAAPLGSRAEVIFEEPRRFLVHADPYDLILVAAGEPASGASSRFYTREFFLQCSQRLAPGGVVAIRLAAAENVWPRPLALRTASIVAALRQAFRSVELLPGATLYVFASARHLSTDPAELAARMAARSLRPRLITPPYLEYLYTNDRRGEVARMLRAAPAAGPNRDAAPVCYQYAAMTWLSTFYPSLASNSMEEARDHGWAGWAGAAAFALAAIAWARRRDNRQLGLSLLAVGFIGMVLETLLLLRFQIANGVIYQQVGWLLTCFMAGMTAGGLALGGSGREAAPGPQPGLRAAIPLMAAGIALVAWVAVAWFTSTAGLSGTSALLAAAGAAVGGCFAAGARLWRGQVRAAASVLYAADLAGGAAGAVAATLVLVPAVGLDRSAASMAVLAAALLLVIPRSGSGVR